MISEQSLFSKIQHNRAIATIFAEQQFVLDASGCLYWPKRDLLVFSDLHFEKGSFLSQFNNPLPQYDSAETLAKMKRAITDYMPQKVLCLGDSFHDGNAALRMAEKDKEALNLLVANTQEWIWILGNHDPDIPDEIRGEKRQYCEIDQLLWVHEPEDLGQFANVNAQVIGHFHPKMTVKKAQQKMTGKCFVISEDTFLMPSLGQYTGGLSVEDEAISTFCDDKTEFALLYNSKIFLI